jgi:iron(III) transport system substrate-binding protein
MLSGLRKRTPSPRRGEGWGEGVRKFQKKICSVRTPSLSLAALARPLPSGERWSIGAAILACCFAAIALCLLATSVHAQTMADLAHYSGPDRTQRLIEGAKKEGVVTLYSSAVITDTDAIIDAFQKKYDVAVRLWRGSSDDILRRAVGEARGGRHDADLAETAGNAMEGLERERLLAEVASPVFAQLMPQAVVPHRGWIADRLSVFTAAYNTTVIKAADVPKSYQDLVDPKWQGKLGVSNEADDANWFMAVADAMGQDKAVALFRKIAATNGMSVRRGHTLLSNLVVAGEVPLALNLYDYRVTELKQRAAPIDGIVLPPAFALPTGIGAMAKAPHPNAALLLLDFYLTDGQRILVERGNVPTNRTVAEPPPGVGLLDVAKFLDQEDKWTRLFKETFAGAAQ